MFCCEMCGQQIKADTITCDPCHASRLRGLLASKAWMDVRGVCPAGDGTGRTLAEALTTELNSLSDA